MAIKKVLPCEFMDYIINADLTAVDYKVLLLLLKDKATQAQLARCLGKQSQNINRSVTKLKSLGLVVVESVDGRNKFYKAVTVLPNNDKTN